MRILITTHKLISHFRPMLPFAHGLKARGHDVRIATLPDLADEIKGHGFGYLELIGPSEAERADHDERARQVPRKEAGKFHVREFFMGSLPFAALPGLLDALQDWRPDLILRETTEFSGLIAAQKFGIRHARFEIINGESEESITTNYAKQISALRAFVGLEPVDMGYLKSELSFSAHPKVLDDTPRVNSREPFRFRTGSVPSGDDRARPDWLPPDDKPLVYMTFGTIAAGVDRAKHVFRVGLEAVSNLPVNVLMTTGANAPADLLADVPSNVMVREFAPQADVLPHAQLMVCHGGSGTVLGGLAAGVPMVISPLFADQPDNARCLEAAGLCVNVDDAEAGPMRAAISSALGDTVLRGRAQKAALEFAQMPTLEQALDRLVDG